MQFALRMGDSTLVLGHRLSEWCGHAPVLEEDLAIANTALDLLGSARHWLSLAAELEGGHRTEDDLAFGRDASDYFNLLLVEEPNGDYADTLARQLYFDAWHTLMLEGLTGSTNAKIADISRQARSAAAFHLRRSSDLIIRLGDGTTESHDRMQRAINDFWIFTGELFDKDGTDEALIAGGVIPDVATLQPAWQNHIEHTLGAATLALPPVTAMRSGGRRGVHGEHLGFLLAEMQFLPRAYPGARW